MRAPEKETQAVRYLLGKLSEDERVAFEEVYFSDDAVFDELRATDAELLDAYVRGELTPEERESFEKTLESPRRREKVELARVLGKVTAARPERPPAVAAPWRGWRLAAAVLLAAAGLGLLFEASRLRAERTALAEQRALLQQQVARLEKLASANAARVAALERELADTRTAVEESSGASRRSLPAGRSVSFLLVAGLLREGSGRNELRIPSDAGLIVLEIPVEGPDVKAPYRARIERVTGENVWSRGALRFHIHRGITTVPLRVPADQLRPGDYIARLERVTPGGVEVVAESAFRILS